MDIYIYQWFVDDDNEEITIRGYGIDKKKNNICIDIKNFKPWLFLESKSNNLTKENIKRELKRYIYAKYSISNFQMKEKLYFDHGGKKFKIFPIYFDSIKDRKISYYILRKKKEYLSFKVHDFEASPLLQFLSKYNLPSCGWIRVRSISLEKKNTYTRYSKEYIVDTSHLESLTDDTDIPKMKCLSFDLETYSSDETRHPDFKKDKDEIFQIGVSIHQNEKKERNFLFTLSPKPFLLKNGDVKVFKTEQEMLDEFCSFLKVENPHIIMGYNIFGFDIPYLYHRCVKKGVLVKRIGMPKDDKREAEYKEIKWSSSAYSHQEFHYIDLEGRIWVDLLPIVRRDYKLSNYKLKTVGTFFLGETKDPITVMDIFEAYRLGFQGGNMKKLIKCGKYCIQDARLVLLLFQKLQTWIGLIEMAKLCNVNIMSLYTQGQQIKVYSQVYQKCYKENRLVDSFESLNIPSNISFQFENYCGAYVFTPIPGKYKWVIPFDFSSLYPTTIIAYNIDYSTLVYDENVPDSECHVIQWKEGEHNYKFRFRKSPKGVIPSLLESLLNQRNRTKKLLKNTEDDVLKIVLDKRQLAYKISANSMYGAMGVQRGYIPFLPGAMCTTAKGRNSIQKAAGYVQEKHQGKIIYGDSIEKNSVIYIKYKDDIRIYQIEDYFNSHSNIIPYPQFKPDDQTLKHKEQYVFKNNSHEIMTHNDWSPIKRLIRHKTTKTLFKIYTTSGSIIVTEDHSLLLKSKSCIQPKNLVVFEHELLVIEDESKITNKLFYQKEKWNGFFTLRDGKILFHDGMDEKYIAYVYFTFLKNYPNSVFLLKNDKYYIDLFNKEKFSKGLILRIDKLESVNDYVYDIETEEGSFHAGNGSLIVKNTDSIYCHFPNYEKSEIVWKKAKSTEIDFLKLFPSPMQLLFEEKIYKDFLILTKKRYMAYTCNEDGIIDEKMTIRGVLLARRDNCLWTRLFYEKVVRSIMESKKYNVILEECNNDILKLFQWSNDLQDIGLFTITKSLNADYKIRELSVDETKAKKRYKELEINYPTGMDIQFINKEIEKGFSSIRHVQEYIDKSKPGHVQLANRMNKRGLPISIGSRMEYIIIEHNDDPNGKLGSKMEDPSYFSDHCGILRIDRLHYLKSIVPSIDQLFEIVFKKKDVLKKIYDYHLKMFKVKKEWKKINEVLFKFI